jgi:hypothetical protein
MMTIKENPQRAKNFWEPIYSPENDNKYQKWEISDENIGTITGKKKSWVQIDDFAKVKTKRIRDFKFDYVDFIGNFDDSYMTFNECTFTCCSFYRSSWKNIKFRDCMFQNTSFSISKFENCEFRDCKFNNISISGNEMKFINSYIEPQHFIAAATTNLDPDILHEQNVLPEYQSYRLEKTKSSVARMLLQMKPIKNDIDTYVQAKRIARKSESFFQIKKHFYEIKAGKLKAKFFGVIGILLCFIEFLFISTIGWLSGWGLKTGRALILGLICTILFALYYHFYLFQPDSFVKSYLRGLEYWFLFGYTRYDISSLSLINKIVVFLNSLLGLFWFATILPVLIEKMGKENE